MSNGDQSSSETAHIDAMAARLLFCEKQHAAWVAAYEAAEERMLAEFASSGVRSYRSEIDALRGAISALQALRRRGD